MEGKPAFVPKRHIPLLEVLETAPASGAVPVLSHPGAYFENATPEDLKDLQAHGLDGLEVFTSYHDAGPDPVLRRAGPVARPGGHGRFGFPRPDQAARPLRLDKRRALWNDIGITEETEG